MDEDIVQAEVQMQVSADGKNLPEVHSKRGRLYGAAWRLVWNQGF